MMSFWNYQKEPLNNKVKIHKLCSGWDLESPPKARVLKVWSSVIGILVNGGPFRRHRPPSGRKVARSLTLKEVLGLHCFLPFTSFLSHCEVNMAFTMLYCLITGPRALG